MIYNNYNTYNTYIYIYAVWNDFEQVYNRILLKRSRVFTPCLRSELSSPPTNPGSEQQSDVPGRRRTDPKRGDLGELPLP